MARVSLDHEGEGCGPRPCIVNSDFRTSLFVIGILPSSEVLVYRMSSYLRLIIEGIAYLTPVLCFPGNVFIMVPPLEEFGVHLRRCHDAGHDGCEITRLV